MVLRIFKGLWYIYLKVYIYFMLKIKNNFLFRSMNTRKMYKNLSPESVPAMPMVPSAQTFNLDIPENKSTMTTWNRTLSPCSFAPSLPTYPRASSRGWTPPWGNKLKVLTHWSLHSGKHVVRHWLHDWSACMDFFLSINFKVDELLVYSEIVH